MQPVPLFPSVLWLPTSIPSLAHAVARPHPTETTQDAQGTEMYKVDLDLASLLQHEQQTESVQHLALAPAHASTKSAVSAAGFSTASASGGAGDASAGPRLRVIAWSCHESVPVSSRMYNAATRAASGSTASLDDDRFGRSSDASQVPGFGRASSLQLQAEAAELKGEVSPVLKSAAAAGAAAKPAISGSASAGAGAGAGDAGDARAERHRKISVMFGQVMAGQPRADGAASYSAASASAGASGGGDTPGAEDGQTSPQDGSAGGAGVAERKPAKRDRNRFASMDVSNMVSERRNADLDAATEAIRNMSVREGEEDPFGDDDDGEGEGLAAQRAYTKSTRDRGFERFLANDGDGAGHRNLAED